MRCVIYLRVSTREQVEKGEGEEGFSIPAQREACTRHIRDATWDLVDEYVDRGESARSADRPALKAMLARIAEARDVDAVVLHKIDRLARNMEDHVAIRALLRRKGVALVSVTENVEETASGRLVEGIHALMAEFYSANLAAEIKKGLSEKAKQGGFPHGAPLGYVNLREVIVGHQVARIVPDPERAPLVTLAFEHYATGEWTLQRLAGELAHRGLTGRARRDREPKAITWQGLAKILANPVYVGIVEWNGVQHPGTHEPLVGPETFRRVQELLAARAARGTRERKHPHYLKGLLHCGVCGRRLSIQHSKGRYTYFFCLGQKNDPAGTCRERYVAADDLEAQVEELYARIELPATWAERLREEMAAEIVERHRADAAQRELLSCRVAKAEAQRRKLLDAYYAGAIDVTTLKSEQARIGADIQVAKDRLGDLDANLGEWQEILELAATFATRCGDAYAKASDRTRKQFNAAVFERLDVKDGRLCHEQYRPPFDDIFNASEFEYGTRVVLGWHSTRPPFAQVDGISVRLPASGTVFRQRPGDPPVRLTDQLQTELSIQRRLKLDEVAELVTAYQQGTTVKELAARYRINRTTVLGHLRRQGVPKRHLKPVVDGDADKAVRLYGTGASIAAVAEELRIAPTTVRRVLKKASVELRPRGRTRRLDQRSR